MIVNMFQKPVLQNRLAFTSDEIQIGDARNYRMPDNSEEIWVTRNESGKYDAHYRNQNEWANGLDENPVIEVDENGNIVRVAAQNPKNLKRDKMFPFS